MQISARHGFRSAWRAPAVLATIYVAQGLGLLFEYAIPSDDPRNRKPVPVLAMPGPGEALRKAERAA